MMSEHADAAYKDLVAGDIVTISKDKYEDLLEDVKFLNSLLAAGVDNWAGYDYALEIFNGEE